MHYFCDLIFDVVIFFLHLFNTIVIGEFYIFEYIGSITILIGVFTLGYAKSFALSCVLLMTCAVAHGLSDDYYVNIRGFFLLRKFPLE